jgi:sulfite exporter TauE/SafE
MGVARVLDFVAWHAALRVALGIVLVLVALRIAGVADRWHALQRIGLPLGRWLAPLRRRAMPANTLPRRWALGMLWGWLPCGLSGSLLLVAWLESHALHGALVMLSFGLGTLPAMLPLTYAGSRIAHRFAARGPRRAAAALVLLAGVVTAAAPWLMQVPVLHAALAALGCRAA